MSKPTQAGKSGSNSNLNEAKDSTKDKQDIDNAGRMEGGKGNSQSGTQGNKSTTASSGSKSPSGSGSGSSTGSGSGSKSR